MSTVEGAVSYPFRHYPDAGAAIEVAQGVFWLSTPLPFRLCAINLYLLEDDDGWTIVDCGYPRAAVREQWEAVWAATLKSKPVTRVIITHYHPDHAGNAAWLSERWGLRVCMTRAEWLTGSLENLDPDDIARRHDFYRANGLNETLLKEFMTGVIPYGVQLPTAYNRLVDGDEFTIGGKAWKVIVSQGHSPEHASLYCAETGVLLAGDQLLPQITTNVCVWPSEPGADALGLFLKSLDHFEAVLRPDTLILPSHRRPFRGVHARIAELKRHHSERLDDILALAADGPVTAGALLPHLFPPDLDGHQITFAMGEALAHLNHLVESGHLRRHVENGVTSFALAERPGR
jgi:glyoxylase-like metal-dependent hydrolase (beta-lactamase superfamily II)